MNSIKNGEETTDSALGAQLRECAASIGGKNFFLTLVETIRDTKPGVLLSEKREIIYPHGTMTWNKTLFHDNWKILADSAKVRTKDGNILPPADDRRHKKILNMIRTFKPLVFHIVPANPSDGEGFSFAPLQLADQTAPRISPLFKALFILPIDEVKKALLIA